jgi:molybdopterin/thiamine biosynthesis adenylyltransferase
VTAEDTASDLSASEWGRYARQIGPGVLTREGQLRLKNSRVLISRVGGIGGPAALSLAMAGVGSIIIAHGGSMIPPDLNRQVLGSEAVVGKPRANHFAETLREANQFVTVKVIDHEPDDDEAEELGRRVDLIVAGPPTFRERLRLNRAAIRAGIPFVDAAQWGMMGTLTAVLPGRSACLGCVYPQEPDFEQDFPVVGAISAAMGSLAALEVIKILSGTGQPMFGRMLIVDGYSGRTSQMELRRDPACPFCGSGAT